MMVGQQGEDWLGELAAGLARPYDQFTLSQTLLIFTDNFFDNFFRWSIGDDDLRQFRIVESALLTRLLNYFLIVNIVNISRKIVTALTSAALVASLAAPAFADTDPRTGTTWTTATGAGGVNVIPYVRSDRNAMFVDFESSDNFANVAYIYFNMTYNSDALGNVGVKRGVEGSFIPSQQTPFLSYNGKSYVRRQIYFGTCSNNVCTFDPNVRNVKIQVNTKYTSGPVDQYTKVLTVNY